MYFRQLMETGRKNLYYIIWNPNGAEFPKNGCTKTDPEGAWEYTRDKNKSTFKLELIK